MKKDAILEIKKNCGFSGTVISASKEIIIEQNVLCGANVLITDSNWHEIDPSKRSSDICIGTTIRIEENVWIGTNVIILPGVCIGKNSVIGANSVVTNSIPENVIAAGNPCVVKRFI